jgi:hypothetical protein
VIALADRADVAGWIIVACYGVAAALCVWALRVAHAGARRAAAYGGQERRASVRVRPYRASMLFWLLVAGLFVFLAFNKQVDLQTWLTDLGRRVAEAQGWYDQRRAVQTAFVCAVMGTGMTALGVLLYFTRDLLPRHVLAFVGVVILGCFLFTRASSFHDIDEVLSQSVLGIKLRWPLELAGIVCVAVSALRNSGWYHLAELGSDEVAPQPPPHPTTE